MNEDEAYRAFMKLRWPETGGKPVCPQCGSRDYRKIKNRTNFRCASCRKQFSATSGTGFAYRKLSYSDIMSMTNLTEVNDISLNGAATDSGVEWRTAKAFFAKISDLTDGAYVVTRSQKTTPITTSYPYAARREKDTPDYLHAIDRAIPRGLPDEMRADIGQAMVLDILEGKLATQDIAAAVSRYIRGSYKFHDFKFGPRSLDEFIPGTDVRLIDTI